MMIEILRYTYIIIHRISEKFYFIVTFGSKCDKIKSIPFFSYQKNNSIQFFKLDDFVNDSIYSIFYQNGI